MQISSYIKVLDDHQHVEASQRGLRFRDEVDKGPAEAVSIDTDRIPSNDTNKPASIDITISLSIDTGRKSEQKEFDVRGNLRDGDTTMRSDKSGIKKRRNWKKRKMIKDGLQGWRYHHAIRQVWDKEEEELEEEKNDQGRSSGIIDPSLFRWCQEIQSAQYMLLTAICKASSTPYC
ncbi:hypothetical protein F2Q69_00048488 [Brassica cretica]|uniref:Uncharacterized protein n=1 Tax=Brassica cretica TaxID=69181 RepID=A0A8S9PYM1_BRACR|nr:hypothetical protein F2Q69_00048488 [Brassica cretica]